jgi:phosphopantetheine adenylyltransferase
MMPPMLPYSLFIGRFQPLYEGHKALIQNAIDEGYKPLVALRDTPYGDTDPYTVGERRQMFKDAFGDKVKVIAIPDIAEVCYGRKVGWGIRQIILDEATEAISATAIRQELGV